MEQKMSGDHNMNQTTAGWRKRQIALDQKAEKKMTFEERCRLSEQCLPNAPYRDKLTALHNEMLKALAQPEPWEKFCDSNCVWTDHHPDCKLVQQEPVGEAQQMSELVEDFTHCIWDARVIPVGTKLYTTPPQRTWVGLTNNEVNNLAAGCHLGNSVQDAIYKAEAKLKEKNT